MEAIEEYVTPKQVAELTGRDRQTVYRWFRERKLTRIKVGAEGPGRKGRTLARLSEVRKLMEPRPCKDARTP